MADVLGQIVQVASTSDQLPGKRVHGQQTRERGVQAAKASRTAHYLPAALSRLPAWSVMIIYFAVEANICKVSQHPPRYSYSKNIRDIMQNLPFIHLFSSTIYLNQR